MVVKLHLTRASRARAKAKTQREQHHAQALQDRHAELQELRKAYLIVRTNGEFVAYRRGRAGAWSQWRAIQMVGGLDSPRVGTRPTTDTRVPSDVPHPRTLKVERETPDTFPEEWCNA